ncbi:DNA-binding transcriptional regulator, MarR family [Saccharopolyspora antimicrobica]|uniref:DNA-binding transcriptional regulator, MarR family n=1 Tax=Saccharopolyspora antimicrobica TaxID=455193 RepID=A0A1I4W0B6_9PSEU|nr:MarR family transcriptional regulator [Saccharopolyspora antimicrobica]RKT87127.1 MarR family transcriptional regulator [Saccharopolyspora antimicrobica]SFN07024.1 DNA-binding transcriptional regulator, MarR family [Saccharopolyspora antimicrobica]
MVRRSRSRPDAVDFMLAEWRREVPDVDASGMAVFGRLHRAFHRYQDQLNRLFHSYDLTMAGFGILASLRRAGSPYRRTAGELADAALVTTGGITQRVDKLEAAGLVRRERDAGDRRAVYVQLTEKGLAFADEVAAAHFANERDMLSGLSATEQERLADLLSRLEASLDHAEAKRAGE